jgi:23S rRNA (adenine2030-N6)-methyltransferase
MLSYQHAYHAGNPADLHKHAAFARLIAALVVKPRGITVMETHAGRGLYDLSAPEAIKTGEAALGIGRGALPPGSYADAVAATRAAHGPDAYPGSPFLARHLLRPQDRLVLMELHPAEYRALRSAFGSVPGGGPEVALHRRDGFEGVLALAPPTPRKGLVLIDPSYEVKTDYETVPAFVAKLLSKWPEAVVLVWYPILPDARHEVLEKGFVALPHVRDEVRFGTGKGKGEGRGMTGSGLIGVNLPYGFDLKV